MNQILIRCIKKDDNTNDSDDSNITIGKVYITAATPRVDTYSIIDDNGNRVGKYMYKFEVVDNKAARLLYSGK